MALPRYHAGKPKAVKVKPPQGSSAKTLKVKVPAKTTTSKTSTTQTSSSAPITPGSSITDAQAQRIAANATTTKYGPQGQALNQQLANTIQQGADQAGYYQQYLNELAGYRKDVTDRANATNAQTAVLQSSVRGLDQTQANQTNAATAADAAARGATVDGSAAKTASDASATRQALLAGLNGYIAARGQSAGDYASKLASVVGPGQALQAKVGNQNAQSQVQAQIAGLGAQKGSYKQSVIDQLRSDEAKNVLAASIASGKDIASMARTTETVRHNKAVEGNQRSSLTARSQANAAKVNSYGYTTKDWAALSTSERQKVIKDFKAGKPKVVKPTSGPGSITPQAENRIVTNVQDAASWVRRLKAQGKDQHTIRTTLLTGLSGKNSKTGVTVHIPAFETYAVNAAMDLGFLEGLSPANIKALQALGVHAKKRFKLAGASQSGTVQPGVLTGGPFPVTGLG